MTARLKLKLYYLLGSQKRCIAQSAFGVTPAQKLLERAKARIELQDQIKPFVPPNAHSPLTDTFNRHHTYLRISITERCNLRCTYCMPEEGVDLTPSSALLSTDEIIRLAALFVRNGVTKIRLTGGEPSIRKDIVEIVRRLSELRSHGLQILAMTSNGIALNRKLPALVESGLTHLNLSLDTLDPFKFQLMTRRKGHEAVLNTLDTAISLVSNTKLKKVKLNVVVIRNFNEDEVYSFAEMTHSMPISIRFIEFMPFNGNKWDVKKMVPSKELLERLKSRFPSIESTGVEKGAGAEAELEANDTAKTYRISGYKGTIGFISSMSDHFCGTCNRLRLTADGKIKVCLFDAKEVSLLQMMRAGASEDELLDVIGMTVWSKKARHAGMENIDVIYNRSMIKIGLRANLLSRRLQRHHSLSLNSNVSPSSLSRRWNSNLAPAAKLSHLDDHGSPTMVDVSSKEVTSRNATAIGSIYINELAFNLLTQSSTDVINAMGMGAADPVQVQKYKKTEAKAGGNALVVAKLAGIIAAKSTSTLIPLCHLVPLTHVDLELTPIHEIHENEMEAKARSDNVMDSPMDNRGVDQRKWKVMCQATVRCEGKTGVEMEALTAVSVSLLTLWDMLKAVAGKEMEITDIRVVKKEGGKSGDFVRQ